MVKIGFVGYSGGKFDETKAIEIIDSIFDKIIEIAKQENEKDIVIISGATNMGIPKLVYERAVKDNLKTIGVMCKEGYTCELFPCDEIYALGNNWGDESDKFLSMLDVLFRIGGGPQSMAEIKKAKEMGIYVSEFELPEIK
jgi:hypothetical protein